MSAHHIAVIRCNGAEDCGAETHTPFETSRAAVVREFRKKAGWHARPGSRDICPDCWSAGHR